MINFINHNHQTLLPTQGPNIKQTIHKMNKIQQQIHTHTHTQKKQINVLQKYDTSVSTTWTDNV